MSKNVPKLRFKGFEDEWKEKKLINFLSESRIPGSNGSKAKKLTVKLWAKGVVPKKEIYEGSDNTKYYTRKAGQLMYGKLDFLNCAFGIVPDHLDGYESTVDAPAFDIKNINPYFLFSKIIQKNFYKRNGDIADGSRKAKRIHSDVFLNMSIKVPSLEEQEKIANFLSKVDSIIEKQGKKIQYWNFYKKGMMQKIFKQEIRFKDDKGLDYPEWEEMTLGDVDVELTRGPFGSALKKEFMVDKGIETYKVYEQKHAIQKNIKIGEYYINKEKYNELKRFKVNPGDFIMSCSGTVGELFKIPNNAEKGVINQALLKIEVGSKVNEEYFLYCFRKNLDGLETKGSGIKNITSVKFLKEEFIMPIPFLKEQEKIGDFFVKIDAILDKEYKKLEELKHLKKGLLQQIFI
ncbi:MAG: restriction endonuclease subunit S [Clostridium perfringens]|uniref:Restriction endonuclease subunit S n=1 Tax=Clostridium perfringens TaxID=1502 RepID=A0AAW4J0F3_CLOPF|nr:restriction endonuclease subunit S [Clostridium perfringens]EHP50507.1 hypothetical protein HMPREF9476_00459 [Clostridium perfringens WAL-14572]MBO3354297.1 restriction endonuclease subunit S [Clostridium perfringens]MBO3357567.1 restriction endonuclease subunit S [Clostridium perfringens]MCX0368189.1 restriction endonuclease subunit S [Clostridium perfringens]MDU2319443.1 restriction endonuclease subunit S [Clostridium perfringens]